MTWKFSIMISLLLFMSQLLGWLFTHQPAMPELLERSDSVCEVLHAWPRTVATDHMEVYLQLNRPGNVRVVLVPCTVTDSPLHSPWIQVTHETLCSAQLQVKGLQAATCYTWYWEVQGQSHTHSPRANITTPAGQAGQWAILK